MARNLYSRLQLTGTIVTDSPLHVGGYGEDVETDLPLARNGAGQLYIPGTSLAGSLRQWAEEIFVNHHHLVADLWGFQKNDQGDASLVIVEDAVIENSEQVVVEIRDHVGIDREFGSAAESIKYDRAILPRGTKLPLHLTVEVTESEKRNQALAMLAALKNALESAEVRLGAAKTRGLGHVRLLKEGAKMTEQRLNSRQGILDVLHSINGLDIQENEIKIAETAYPSRIQPRLQLTIHWKPAGPLMVKAGFDGIASDILPLTSGRGGNVSLVLPGSSVKGAFRTQAERIVRTLRDIHKPEWLEMDERKKFLHSVQVPLVDELFGSAKARAPSDDGKDWQPGLSALDVADCYGANSIKHEHWQAIQAATNDIQLQKALTAAGLQVWSQTYHVAIDRWLGSAADQMLFTVLEPHDCNWEPLSLEVNLGRLHPDRQWAGLALLLLVIRDLANDRLPLGFATNRGMGSLQVTRLEMKGHGLDETIESVCQTSLENGNLTNLPEPMKTAWQAWIDQTGEMAL